MLKYGVMAANRGGKLKTVTQAVAVILYLLPLPASGPLHWFAVVVMAAAFIVTVLTGLDYVREAVKLRRQATSNPG
jgi:CDP-diacylglycerol--glycerol-3-phosphate 3-phosphatidyltransferase